MLNRTQTEYEPQGDNQKADAENNYDYQNKLRNLLYPLEEDLR